MKNFFLSTLALFLYFGALPAKAQEQEFFDVDNLPPPTSEAAAQESQTQEQSAEESFAASPDEPPRFELDSFPSVLFTYWEQASIQDAKNSRGMARPVTEEEIIQEEESYEEEPKDPGIRTIALSGISFESGENWTIWLNDQRVTPNAIPKEILDLKVHKTYIELKWFDEYKNQIVPIRIRPHQRFNLDSRIFLPG